MIELNAAQQRVFDLVIDDRKNVFLTGQGGVGKTYLIRKITTELKKRKIKYGVTASTGTAARLIRGSTLHSYTGIRKGEGSAEELYRLVQDSKNAMRNWKRTEVLVIDEISMISADLLDKLEYIARKVRQSQAVFGGIQVLLSGDFLQLPPVDGNPCYKAACWFKLVPWRQQIELRKIIRQTDRHVQAALSQIRRGRVDENTRKLLQSRVNVVVGSQKIKPTRLLSLRNSVAMINSRELDKIRQELHVFKAEDTLSWQGASQKQLDMAQDRLDKVLQAPRVLSLKVGAQVMFIKNEPSQGLVNGSRGVVIGYEDDCPVVKFMNKKELTIEKHTWRTKLTFGAFATRKQFPLLLAWAVTIHKSQGATLDVVEVDLTNCFAAGQAYVALSRVKNFKHLCIRVKNGSSINFDAIQANPEIRDYYDKLNNIQTQIEKALQAQGLKRKRNVELPKLSGRKAKTRKKTKKRKLDPKQRTLSDLYASATVKASSKKKKKSNGFLGHLKR